MAFRKVNDDSLATVATAIRAKGGTTEQMAFPDWFVSAISAIQAGGGGSTTPSAKWGDVTFIDYDGSVLYSYTLAEAKALTELPPLPEHDGLICQGWNWSLESIKALNREVTVGAMYITDDGATRLHIRIATIGRMDVPLYIGQTVDNGVTINWGDGSDAQTLAGTGNVNTTHTYAEPGDYTISLMPADGCNLSLGSDSSSDCVLGSTGVRGRVYCNMLQSVSVGRNVTYTGSYVFKNCSRLESITIPKGVIYIGNYAFDSCSGLKSITIPEGVKDIYDHAFYNCYGIYAITIPAFVNHIYDYSFYSCFSLSRITITDKSISTGLFYNCFCLSKITTPDINNYIYGYAFYNCSGMKYYDFSACTSVPKLYNKDAFSNIPSDCQMLIPSALYSEWSTATNWAAYANYMVAV